ncbi:MAG TPA: GNAT family protein [Mucilaginibacter sp.]|jgi:RimJ/RimL family protein N-acetyltransferase|nr:GNAT family protein [Mucilaginibacter sp.]
MELHGNGFKLRGWKEEDAASLQRHADNTNISDFLFDRFPSPYTMDEAVKWIKLKLNQSPVVNFVIDVDGELAGVIGIDQRDDIYRKSPLLGYWLREDYWGKGIMTGAVKLVTSYAFANLDIVRLQAGVLGNNPRSMRVLEKAGYIKEGILKNNVIKNGTILDEHIYGFVKP